MIKIENGYCEVRGTRDSITEDFRVFLKSMRYYDDMELLKSFIDALDKELEECNEQS